MSKRNIRLDIAFDGANFSGWQRQTNSTTIQGIIESKLSLITNEKIVVNGAGRTDAGVHALAMVANFTTSASMAAHSFQHALNSMLPGDVRIIDATEAAPDFHARYSSTGKIYRYDFFTGFLQMPAERLYRTHGTQPFDINPVHTCLNFLVDTHDFSSFEATGSRDLTQTNGRGAVRTMFRAECVADARQPECFSFYFSGDGFLRRMVRNLAGTLFMVGAHRIDFDNFKAILAGRDRQLAGPTAPAHGLFLVQAHYENTRHIPEPEL